MLKRKVDQAISAKDEVHGRYRIVQNVKNLEFDSRTAVTGDVLLYYLLYDIQSDVIDMIKIDESHPIEIPTGGVKECSYCEFL